MLSLAALPVSLGIFAAFAVGLLLGAVVNWAAYTLAWHPRAISPWATPDARAPLRRWSDRLPVAGWWGLRREAPVHGRGFWIRPIVVELAMAVGLAALYWWEVVQQGLVQDQFAALINGPVPAGLLRVPAWTTYCTFAAHAMLVALMAAASLIDLDEKIIPDEITVYGTLIALVLATAMPLGLLPQVTLRETAAPIAAEIALPAGIDAPPRQRLAVEPTTFNAPNASRRERKFVESWRGLTVGLACYALWLVALTPRIWRGRRGPMRTVQIIAARVLRELCRGALAWIGIIGAIAIIAVWFAGGSSWTGLFTALVGMIGGGAMVWATRIVGSLAMRREAMGFGDVTLMMMVGAFLGWQAGVIVFFVAPFAGLVAGLFQVLFYRDSEIPYGPYLCLGTLAVIVCWARIWNATPGGLQDIFGVGWLVPGALAVVSLILGALLVLIRNVKSALFGEGGAA